jgi:hypothetical protein
MSSVKAQVICYGSGNLTFPKEFPVVPTVGQYIENSDHQEFVITQVIWSYGSFEKATLKIIVDHKKAIL